MNLFNPLIPQIMNVIQQGMQADMTIFHSSYNEQYHQPVIQQFDTLNVNIGVVRSDVDSLTNQFGHLSTSVDNLLVNVMCAEACSAFQFLIFVINL
jgi:septation ring formation regulator EzrA